jgi:hypothetical protein
MNETEIIKLVLEHLKTGNWFLISIILTAVTVYKIKNIFEFFDQLSVRRLTFIKDACALEALDAPTRKALIQELNKVVYKRLTSIRTDQFMRERIDKVLEISKGELSLTQFTDAGGHLQAVDHKLVVQITKADKIESRLSLCFASLVIFVAITLMTATSLVLKANGMQMVAMACLTVILFWSAMLIASPFFTYTAAVRLKPVLVRLQK